jgi:DNA-binding transcriptional MerR regulator
MNVDTFDSDSAVLTIGALKSLAVDEYGNGPSAGAIRTYVNDGLLSATRDSSGRLLFRRSDARRVLQIYAARRARHGATGCRVDARIPLSMA